MKAGRLFESDEPKPTASGSPLAERMRPRTFDEFVGQHELIARGQPLREAIEQDALHVKHRGACLVGRDAKEY